VNRTELPICATAADGFRVPLEPERGLALPPVVGAPSVPVLRVAALEHGEAIAEPRGKPLEPLDNDEDLTDAGPQAGAMRPVTSLEPTAPLGPLRVRLN